MLGVLLLFPLFDHRFRVTVLQSNGFTALQRFTNTRRRINTIRPMRKPTRLSSPRRLQPGFAAQSLMHRYRSEVVTRRCLIVGAGKRRDGSGEICMKKETCGRTLVGCRRRSPILSGLTETGRGEGIYQEGVKQPPLSFSTTVRLKRFACIVSQFVVS